MIHHSQPEGLIWFCQKFLSCFTEPLTTFHSAYCQSPDTHRKKWKSPRQEIIHQSTSPHKLYLSHPSFHVFFRCLRWVNFKTTNNKQMLRKWTNWVWCALKKMAKTTYSCTVDIHKCVKMVTSPHQVYTVGPSGTSLLMWAATGNHGSQWTYADVILSNPAPFRVTFQAEVGGDVWTDIALDDISYTAECVVGGEAKVLSVVSFCPFVLPFGSLFSRHFLSFQPPLHIFHATSTNFHLLSSPLFPHFLSTNIPACLLCFHINCVDPQGVCSQLMESVAL